MKVQKQIYLDYNSTTPCDPRVVEAMLPWFSENFGNAASRSHAFGWKAEEGVELARERVARLIEAEPEEIIFTSGATESDNLALKGVFDAWRSKGSHIITVKAEHKAVLDPCKQLEKKGAEVTYLDVQPDGRIDLEELEKNIRPSTLLVAVMWANNETGVLQDMEAIGKICSKHDVLFFSDATQAVGKMDINPRGTGVHIMAFSAHKMYGPKGTGALYVSRKDPRVKVSALIDGGGHERGFRSGTLNVPGIIGLGKACEIAAEEMENNAAKLKKLLDKLESSLVNSIEGCSVNGSQQHRMPHVTNLSFKFIDSENLMQTFGREIAVSSGSACTSASLEPSFVLKAMGLSDHLAKGAIRFSLGKFTTEEEIDYTVEAVQRAVEHLRSLSPVWQMYKEGVNVEDWL